MLQLLLLLTIVAEFDLDVALPHAREPKGDPPRVRLADPAATLKLDEVQGREAPATAAFVAGIGVEADDARGLAVAAVRATPAVEAALGEDPFCAVAEDVVHPVASWVGVNDGGDGILVTGLYQLFC